MSAAAAPSQPATGDATARTAVALWHGKPLPVADAERDQILTWARHNRVLGLVLRATPDLDPAGLADLRREQDLYRVNLAEVTALLGAAGVQPLLVKTDPWRDFEYGNFDLVVGDDGWSAAQRALEPWGERSTRYRLERSTKLIVHPASGPAAHLHRWLSWFDLPLMDTERLRAGSRPGPVAGLRVPGPADDYRSLLAHALFQNLAVDLGDLLRLRDLLHEAEGDGTDLIADASRASDAEGWGQAFRAAHRSVTAALADLDAGRPTRLPLPLPLRTAIRAGTEHARHLARTARPGAAARELALRAPLVVRKLLWPGRP